MINKLITSLVFAFVVSAIQFPASAIAADSAKKQSQPADTGKKGKAKKKKAKHKTKLLGKRTSSKFLKAFEAYEADDLNGAITILEELDPSKEYDQAYVARYLGTMYYQRAKGDDLDNALKKLTFAVDAKILADNEHSAVIKLLADLQMQTKAYKKALANYYKWMEFSEKEEATVYIKITQAYLFTRRLDKMIATADKAIELYEKPDRNPYILKIQSYYQRKMYKDAINVLETVVQIFPADKQWWVQLGSFYLLAEQFDKATQTLDLAYRQGFLVTEAQIKTLASLYSNSEVPYKAALLLEKHIASGLVSRDDRNIANLANAWHSASHIDKAAKYYGELAKMTNESKYFRKQGVLLKQDEQFTAAIKALKKSLELGHKNPGSIQMAIAECYFYLEKYKLAYKAIKEAMKDPKSRKYAKPWIGHIKSTALRKKVSVF